MGRMVGRLALERQEPALVPMVLGRLELRVRAGR